MTDFVVDKDTSLDRFLLGRIQPWRVPILFANGGIKVLRGKSKGTVKLTDSNMPLKTSDTVRLVTPLPKLCAEALQREANDNWRDYAIVPGGTTFDVRMAKFVQARTKTILIQNPLLFILKNFIDGLATSGEIVNPIRHLLIVGHANLEGAFKIAMYESAKVAAKVFYEDLEEAVKNKSVKDKSLVMDLSVMYPRPVDPDGKTPHLLLLGCDIGGQAPYMQKFKEALGGQILLIAPKRIVIGATVRTPPGESAYMGYHFSLLLPAKGKKKPAAKNRADLIDKLVKKSKDPEFALEDGSAPTRSSWRAWLPDNPNRAPNPTKPTEIPNSVKLPVFPGTSNAPGHFFYIQERHFFSSPQTLALDKDTGKEADRKNAVKTDLQKLARYMDNHLFPEYVRFGYKTMDEFMDGWNWQFKYDKGTKVLSYDPIRDEYHLWQPIVRIATGTLVINYYPTGLVPKRFQSQMPIETIRVNDTFLFGVY